MLITNPKTGEMHDEPLCRTGCGAFEATPNPLCAGRHGNDSPDVVMRRICANVGHLRAGGAKCLRCKKPLPA